MSASDDKELKDQLKPWAEVSVNYESGGTVYAGELDEITDPDADSVPQGPVQLDAAGEQQNLAVTAPLADTLNGVQARLAAEELTAKLPEAAADAELTAPLPSVDATTPLPAVIALPDDGEEPAAPKKDAWPVMQAPLLLQPSLSAPSSAPPSKEYTTSGGSRILPEQLVEPPEEPAAKHKRQSPGVVFWGKVGGAVLAACAIVGLILMINPGDNPPKQGPKASTSQSATPTSDPSKGSTAEPPKDDTPVTVSDQDSAEPAKPTRRSEPTKAAPVTAVPETSASHHKPAPQPSKTRGNGGSGSTPRPATSAPPTHTSTPDPEPSSPPVTSAPPTVEPPTEEPTSPSTGEPGGSAGGSSENTAATP